MPKKKTRTVRKTVFFQGAAFIIEEEVEIDSDMSISVKTSEDSYEVDDRGVRTRLLNVSKQRIHK